MLSEKVGEQDEDLKTVNDFFDGFLAFLEQETARQERPGGIKHADYVISVTEDARKGVKDVMKSINKREQAYLKEMLENFGEGIGEKYNSLGSGNGILADASLYSLAVATYINGLS